VAEVNDVETWVREELSLSPNDVVAITEKPGTDPRCSSIVTEVAVGGPDADAYSFHVEQSLSDMTRIDLVAAIAFGGGH
jgi:hypothetical protein